MRRYLFFVSELYALAILRPLQDAIRDRGDRVAWFIDDRLAAHLRPDEMRLETVGEVKASGPQAVFAPGNWVPDFFPGLKVEVFHGFNAGKRAERKGHFRIRGLFDLYCTQGPSTTVPFQKLADRYGYFRVVETGWPKMDPLFRDGGRGPAEERSRPTVLYASTFNEPLTSAVMLFETIEGLAATGEWRWLVTFHPKMAAQTVARYRSIQSEHLQFVETDDVVSVLKRADVMLSDTSSVLSEFLLLDRPVVTFRNRRPGPYLLDVREPAELRGAIARALSRPPELMAAARAYADEIHPYRDGLSSRRVLEAADDFMARGRSGLERKPLNLWRKLQARRRLSYYRLR